MHKTYDELSGWQKYQVSTMFFGNVNEYREWYYEIGLSSDVLSRRRDMPEDERMRKIRAPELPGLE